MQKPSLFGNSGGEKARSEFGGSVKSRRSKKFKYVTEEY
jgi:hypothetical protein